MVGCVRSVETKYVYSYFFFQAEDGIRDIGVTGVQTCALPILTVGRPDEQVVAGLRPGQAVLGMLAPLPDPEFARRLAEAGVTAISLDLIPRTLPRAQAMDALTSQANIAGYKAALVAAGAFGRFFPLLITAARTARAAKVLALRARVAGLPSIRTAPPLGAAALPYDVPPQAKTDLESPLA